MRMLFFFTIMTIMSCSDTDLTSTSESRGFQSDDELYPTVVPELRPFYMAFERAAAERGIDIDLTQEGITGNIVELGNNAIAGLCLRVPDAPNRVAVDIGIWNSSDNAYRELIVFHELGHCVLGRDHLDDHQNGTCQSIMHSGTTDCVTPLDDPALREEYLNELFFN